MSFSHIFFTLALIGSISWGVTCNSATANTLLVSKSKDVRALLLFEQGLPFDYRIGLNARFFLGQSYLADPLGEGANAAYDQDPRYRFDGFDCTTFVETVIALSHARDFEHFKYTMDRIRYKNGVVDFTSRNHFPEIDWIPNNTRLGILEDVTPQILEPLKAPFATALFDKRNWYAKMPITRVNVVNISEAEKIAKLEGLRREGMRFGGAFNGSLDFIPLDILFKIEGASPTQEPEINRQLLARFPNGLVMNFIRVNPALPALIGTEMLVSHQGIVARDPKTKEVMLIHATPTRGKEMVVSLPLAEYLRTFLGNQKVLGINLQKIK